MSDVQILHKVLLDAGRDVPESVIAGWDTLKRMEADHWARARRMVDAGHILNLFCSAHEGNDLGLALPCICVPPRPEFIDQAEVSPFAMARA